MGRHLWNGISTVRVNCGTAIVGDPAQVAEELLGYWRLGVDEFILAGLRGAPDGSAPLERHLDGAGELRDGDRGRPGTGGRGAARLLAPGRRRVHPRGPTRSTGWVGTSGTASRRCG